MINFPTHKGSLTLEHNVHLDCYDSIRKYLCQDHFDFSNEEITECEVANEVWMLRWYPDTPVGFYIVIGPTLESVLIKSKEIK